VHIFEVGGLSMKREIHARMKHLNTKPHSLEAPPTPPLPTKPKLESNKRAFLRNILNFMFVLQYASKRRTSLIKFQGSYKMVRYLARYLTSL
jgi:hypothetical protein